MELLFKYYSNESKYAIENLEKDCICFTPLESLNDPMEGIGKYLYTMSKEEQEFWDKIGSNAPQALADRISEEFREIANFKYRIFSSTKRYDNPLFWAHYANSHKGFCVGYEKESLNSVANRLVDITYQDELCEINEYSDDTIENVLSIKSTDWFYEEECRAIYKLTQNDVEHLDFETYSNPQNQLKEKIYIPKGSIQTRDLEMLCSEKFIMRKCKSVAIYLGLRMDWEEKKRIIKIANDKNMEIFQMTQEKNSFKLVANKFVVDLNNNIFMNE